MRTKKRWKQVISPKVLSSFTPRIQSDLGNIPVPINLKPRSCYIHGKPETGKTIHACHLLLAYSLKQYLAGERMTAEMVNVSDLFEKIKKGFGDNSYSSTMVHYSTIPFLILDDIGANKPSEFVLDILYLIINNRYENNLISIFTSNMGLIELAEKLGDTRIPSRIKRIGKVIKKDKY